MTRSRRGVFLAIVSATLFVAAPAYGHGGLEDVHPRFADRLDEAPKTVWVRFEDPPTRPAVLRVADGCGDPVSGRIRIKGKTMEAPVRGGEPGTWTVEFSATGADGHREKGDWTFEVRGDPCGEEPVDAAGPDDEGDGGDSGVPVVPLLIVAGLAVGVVLVIRLAR